MSKDRVHTVDPATVGAATRDPQPALPKGISRTRRPASFDDVYKPVRFAVAARGLKKRLKRRRSVRVFRAWKEGSDERCVVLRFERPGGTMHLAVSLDALEAAHELAQQLWNPNDQWLRIVWRIFADGAPRQDAPPDTPGMNTKNGVAPKPEGEA